MILMIQRNHKNIHCCKIITFFGSLKILKKLKFYAYKNIMSFEVITIVNVVDSVPLIVNQT